MTASHPAPLSTEPQMLHQLAKLRTEFVDLAFELERQGRVDAADVAVTASIRVGEICEALSSAPGPDERGAVISPA